MLLPLERLRELLLLLCRLVERLGAGVISSESEEVLLLVFLYSTNRLGM